MEVRGQVHTEAVLIRYKLDRSLGGPQSRTGLCEEAKNLLLQQGKIT
jgi:hypothetical protein